MHMEPTMPGIAGTPVVPVVPVLSIACLATEAAEERDIVEETEFWDACWTLEDEMIPRAVVRPEPQSRRISTIRTSSGFALL